jgi:colicin import membrane protein
VNKTFEENINDIRKAKRGVEVREAMAESLEYVEGFASTATQKAEEAAASAKTAAEAKEAAAASARTAEQQAGIATQQAETATQQAEAAESSKAAAAESAKRAEQFAKETEGRVTTDPTLTVKGAPADAKAVGDRINAIKIETDKTLTVANAAADAAATGVRIKLLEMVHGTDVNGISFVSAFDTLDGVALEGVWNKAASRIDF